MADMTGERCKGEETSGLLEICLSANELFACGFFRESLRSSFLPFFGGHDRSHGKWEYKELAGGKDEEEMKVRNERERWEEERRGQDKSLKRQG